jgi:hypothetical protein
VPRLDYDQLETFWSTPSMWAPPGQDSPFAARLAVDFPLAADQFFMLGDNSPMSSDARLWPAERYVERDLLVGKAVFVFWPHAWQLPIPFTDYSLPIIPNLRRMRVIR